MLSRDVLLLPLSGMNPLLPRHHLPLTPDHQLLPHSYSALVVGQRRLVPHVSRFIYVLTISQRSCPLWPLVCTCASTVFCPASRHHVPSLFKVACDRRTGRYRWQDLDIYTRIDYHQGALAGAIAALDGAIGLTMFPLQDATMSTMRR